MSEASADQRASLARRTFLAGVVALPALASCGGPQRGAGSSGPEASELASAASFAADVTALEERYGAEAGVFAMDLASHRTLEHRADQRFMLCSVFKGILAAAMLRQSQDDPGFLARTAVIPAIGGEIAADSATFGDKAGQVATYAELCRAAAQVSDNIAANLLLDVLGGPRKLTAYIRTLGDETTRVDRYEEEMNASDGPLDTTTPRAVATTYQELLLGDALAPPQRLQLTDWLLGATSGAARIRAGLPPSWRVADKTGTGLRVQGELNDVAVAWPAGGRAPLVLAVLTRTPPPRERHERLLAEVAGAAKTALAL